MSLEVIEETEYIAGNAPSDSDNATKSRYDGKQITYYAQRLKLAVAIAVIRATPTEMTPKEYATHLIHTFKEDYGAWKNKYEALEKEVIILEQKLQIASLQRKFNIPDVQVNLNELQNLVHDGPHACMLPTSDLKSKILCAVEFVKSFILLGSISRQSSEVSKEHERLQESVLKSVCIVFGYIRSREGLSLEFNIIKCALDEIHTLFDSKANIFEKDLINLSLAFIENLLLDIYKTLEINMEDYQHRRSQLIQMMAKHKKLSTLILSRLLREITFISEGLAAILQSQTKDFTPLLQMENAYYVLKSTEGTLDAMRQQNSALNSLRIDKSALAEWHKTTEKSLMNIGSFFPMYSIYAWRIKTLLESVLEPLIYN